MWSTHASIRKAPAPQRRALAGTAFDGRHVIVLAGVTSLLYAIGAAAPGLADELPGLGDPGSPVGLVIQARGAAAEDEGQEAVLVGPDARLQLVVTVRYDSGQVRDFSGTAQYGAEPAGIVAVTSTGMVLPLAEGAATVRASAAGQTSTVRIVVENFDNPPPINFPNQVVPIFTKLDCNSGGCHGKSGGQNGFALSLLGFEPEDDYQYLVKEGRGRRLFPASPDRSLLLLKPIGTLPHGGGIRLDPDSDDYRLIRRWIQQGMPYGSDDDPTVTALSVYPPQRQLPLHGVQQLKVVAHYSDGTLRDVTRTAQYTTNNKDMIKVDESGVAEALGLAGDVAIMIRYQGQATAFRATMPLGIEVKQLPPERNFVDTHVFRKLKELGLPPSPVCDDSTFFRRVTLDLAGRLPTLEETKAFLADQSADKRDKAIDRLLDSDGYADYFAQKWAAILRNKAQNNVARTGNFLFHGWIRDSLRSNKPYDQFVREVLAASGDVGRHPPVNWYQQLSNVNEQVEDTAQVFLGVRIACAHCHHHPFEKWSQNDYWSMAAFFSNVKRKPGAAQGEVRVYSSRGQAQAQHPKTGEVLVPAGLGEEPLELGVDDDPRIALADWMARPDNPFFAPALTNRYWKHFFGRGLVDPEDDMRATNPPTHPELLAALSDHFITSGFDLKELVRTICRSTTYQLSELPNDYNARDTQSYSRFYPRRLPAEVMLDAMDRLLKTSSAFSGLPRGIRAVELPEFGGNMNDSFLNTFGRPAAASACECERAGEITMAQSLVLLNSNDMYGKLAASRARELAEDAERSDSDKIVDLYHLAFSRPPTESELGIFLQHLEAAEEGRKKDAFEDVLWALINTKEFMFNH